MNVLRIVIKENTHVISIPYSPTIFGDGLLHIMQNFHRLATTLKFECLFDYDEVYCCGHQIFPEAPKTKFSVRLMNAFLLFIQLFDGDFFCDVMKGMCLLFENKKAY